LILITINQQTIESMKKVSQSVSQSKHICDIYMASCIARYERIGDMQSDSILDFSGILYIQNLIQFKFIIIIML